MKIILTNAYDDAITDKEAEDLVKLTKYEIPETLRVCGTVHLTALQLMQVKGLLPETVVVECFETHQYTYMRKGTFREILPHPVFDTHLGHLLDLVTQQQ